MSVIEAKKCNVCGATYDSSLSYCLNDGTPLVMVDSLIGRMLDGRYRIESLLGKGGMGVVYRATHVHIDSEFAVKVLHPDLVANHAAIERFRREAKAAGRIHHPNAIQVTDFGVTAENIVYLVMELVDGKSLRELIYGEGAFDYHRASEILRQVCGAVEAAHHSGVIHRDLKPDNILIKRIGKAEKVKVLDFGIAKLREHAVPAKTEGTLTKTGMLIGTPQYMSPEQCKGKQLDPRSDIYSLGVILYEMLSGQLPFHADSAIELIVKHVKEAPPPLREVLPTVPEAIERVVMRALEKDPAQRYQSAPELSRAFEEAAQDETSRSDAQTIVDARPPQPSDPTVVVGAAVKTDDMAARAVSTGGGQAAAAQAVHSTSGAADQAILQPPSRLPIKALAAVILIAIVGVVLYFALRPSSTSEKKGVEPAPTEMVLIPGGKFMMGRNDGEDDERPAHEVEVKSFYLDKYEVTNQQYKKFVDATSHPAPRHWKNNGSYAPDEATLPVTHINWQDAVAYAKWAGKRLPTEEEWEYAARGGKSNLYPWGNEWEAAKANVGQQDKKKPAPVGAFAMDRSAFGVYDMAGNVSEWVQNFFTKYGSGQTFEKYKVYRGGNFADEPKTCTATYRWLDEPTLPVDQMPRVGFRCAKDAGQ